MTVRFNARTKFQRWIILDTPFRTLEYNLLALRFSRLPRRRYDRIIPRRSRLISTFWPWTVASTDDRLWIIQAACLLGPVSLYSVRKSSSVTVAVSHPLLPFIRSISVRRLGGIISNVIEDAPFSMFDNGRIKSRRLMWWLLHFYVMLLQCVWIDSLDFFLRFPDWSNLLSCGLKIINRGVFSMMRVFKSMTRKMAGVCHNRKTFASLENFRGEKFGIVRSTRVSKTIRSQLGPRGHQPFVPLPKGRRWRRNPSQE